MSATKRAWNALGPYIRGGFQTSTTRTKPIINPCTGKPTPNHVITEATTDHVKEALLSARQAQASWESTSGSERRDALLGLADAIDRHRKSMTDLERIQTGKPLEDAEYEINDTIECIRYFAGYADKLFGHSMVDNNLHSITLREPYGVVGLVVSFNYPLMLAGWKVAPALAAGNCVVLKPAPQTPLTALALADLATGYLPPGVLSVLPGDANVGRAILEGVDKGSFTGSTKAGQMIMQQQAERLTPLTLECGGKNPVIVLKDADIEGAAGYVALGAFSNAGQNCCAVSRVYVDRSIHDQFVETVIREMDKIDYGPVIDQHQYDRVQTFIQQRDPAYTSQVVPPTLKEQLTEDGYFVPAALFTHVPDDAPMATEEIFGPVLSILEPFDDVESAIQRANSLPYGLAGGVFGKDQRQTHHVASKLRTGYVWINTYNLMPPYNPFGGRKLSGIGKDLGQAALDEFTFVKSVVTSL
ncbi:aldehyde dehydrogenase domain-containing protein [Phascolomyces articulosus]|uniref:Aldehyde dehydrogenase domain-containing protein n=1 Tax=Phascolomyces articulosus TaxID=60185 RepID=A0AAD5JYZ4_9FUNG|nr:aldehyde dehydrogenase domain-containing protein [Phascolomyces articulosus]